MNNVKFIKGTVVTILSKLEKARQKESSKEYKTLTDSLNETVNIIGRQPASKNISPFALLLGMEIEKEAEYLTTIANKSIENDNFKEHHDWIVAYRKLDSIRENLHHSAKRESSKSTLHQYKNYNVYDEKGIHAVVSSTRSQSVSVIYEKFKVDGNEMFQAGNDKHIIHNGNQTIHAYGVSPIIRGIRGDVLHIDKSIGFKNYVELVDGLENGFGIVHTF